MANALVVPDGDVNNKLIGKLKVLNNLFEINNDSIVNYFKVGSGTTTPALTNTDLETAQDSPQPIETGYPTVDTSETIVLIRGILKVGYANGNDLTEFHQKMLMD